MVIRAISPVSYTNGYNQVNFEGKKNNKRNYESGYSSNSFMKSVPLATLIAMSPLNGIQAQTSTPNLNEKIVHMVTYKNPVDDGCNILYISNDGNDDDIEAIALQHGRNLSYTRNIRGIDTKLIKRENFKQYLDTLKTVNVTYDYEDGSPSRTEKKYIVAGRRAYDVYVDRADDLKELKHTSGKTDHDEYEIDKELYDFLKQFMKEDYIKTENRKTKVAKGSDLDFLKDIM